MKLWHCLSFLLILCSCGGRSPYPRLKDVPTKEKKPPISFEQAQKEIAAMKAEK